MRVKRKVISLVLLSPRYRVIRSEVRPPASKVINTSELGLSTRLRRIVESRHFGSEGEATHRIRYMTILFKKKLYKIMSPTTPYST